MDYSSEAPFRGFYGDSIINQNVESLPEQFNNYMKTEFGSFLKELGIVFLQCIDRISYWVVCLGMIYNIWLYAATRNSKYTQRILVLFLSYMFIQLIVGAFI